MNTVTDQMPTIPVPNAPAQAQQILAIDPDKYVALVFEPFREKLARYKAEADAVTFDVTTPAGMKTAIEWRAKFRDELRIPAEAARKERKAPILEIGRLLDARAKSLAQEIAPYETRFDAAIQAEEEKRAALKRAKEEAERARVAEIQRRLAKLQTLPELYTSALAPEKLAEVIGQLEAALTFDYQEFSDAAEAARQGAIVALRQAHVGALERIERETQERLAREAEQARLAAERKAEEERLAEERRRLAEERAEQERQAAERRAADEARAQEERERVEAERQAQERIAQIRQRIVALNGPTHLTATDSPALIAQAMESVRNARITEDDYGDLVAEALEARKAGAARLEALFRAAEANRAEQERMAAGRAELERLQREQEERRLAFEQRQREQRETEERQRREAAEDAARKEAEAERKEAEAARRQQLRQQIEKLTAEDIVRWIASELGCAWGPIAARIADIEHSEWAALAMSDEVTP